MKRAKFGHVPRWWSALVLPVRAYRVGIALWSYADDFGHCYPGIKALCNDTGLDRRNLFRALDDLVRGGLLSIKPGDSEHTNHYWLSLLPGEVALKTREKRPVRVVVPEPLGVVAVDEGRGSGSGTTLTTNKLPSITTDITTEGKERRGTDGLTNVEGIETYLAANVVVEPDIRPGDDFFAIARKRWPSSFKESEVA